MRSRALPLFPIRLGAAGGDALDVADTSTSQAADLL